MSEKKDESKRITDGELLEALEEATPLLKKSPKLQKLISLLVDRLIETSDKFNSHQHNVTVSLDRDEYTSAGEGDTGPPSKPQGYGCNSAISIG